MMRFFTRSLMYPIGTTKFATGVLINEKDITKFSPEKLLEMIESVPNEGPAS